MRVWEICAPDINAAIEVSKGWNNYTKHFVCGAVDFSVESGFVFEFCIEKYCVIIQMTAIEK